MSSRLFIRHVRPFVCLDSHICRHYSTSPSLIVQRDIPAPNCGSIRILSLNNPKTRNAISKALLAELGQHVNQAAYEGSKGQIRALILASNIDASFCAGADLKERQQFTLEETHDFLKALRGTFADISRLHIPTISALSSLALGGGLELALTTHFRVFASTTVVALPESRLAIIPGAGGTYRLPALIGRTRALDMMLTGRRVAAAEAYFYGLCDRLIPVDPDALEANGSDNEASKETDARLLSHARQQALDGAIDLAREICEGGPVAIRKLLATVASPAIQEEWHVGETRENEGYDAVVNTNDRNEALLAFKEKRKPTFKGN